MSKPQDSFFTTDKDVLAVYDFEYDQIVDYTYELSRNYCFAMWACPYCWPCLPCLCCYTFSPMFHDNIDDAVRAQHLAITRDGIKYVKEGELKDY